MLQCFMRIFLSFLYFSFLCHTLWAKEPLMAILQGVHANDSQLFLLGQNFLKCRPYGVISLEEIYAKEQTNQTCRRAIEKFYAKEPLLKHFAGSIFKTKQMYHIEPKAQRCIVYAQGMNTLSELLLGRGLAFVAPFFKDEEFLYSFSKAQRNARAQRLGMWSEQEIIECIAEVYRE